MTYYDNATAIAYKLDRWSKESAPRNFAIEQIAREHSTSSTRQIRGCNLDVRCTF